MKKQLWILLLALVLVVSVVACVACKPEATTYALTYAAGEGSGTAPEAEQVAEGTEVTLKANMFTAPEGKEFDGWLVDGAKKAAGDKITMPAKDLTITAQWKAKEDSNNNKPEAPVIKAAANISVAHEGTATTGWLVLEADGTGLVIVADKAAGEDAEPIIYENITYTINAQGELKITAAENGAITVPANGTIEGRTVSITVKATAGTKAEYKFESEVYKLKVEYGFEIAEGINSTENYVPAGQPSDLTVIELARPGYTLTAIKVDGVKMSKEDAKNATMPKKDITVSYEWEQSEFTLTFKVGADVIDTVKIEKGGVIEADDIPECPANKIPDGGEFAGWFDAQDKELEAGSEVTADATYTAKFDFNSWKVTFKNDNDEEVVWISKDGEGKLEATDIPATPTAPGEKVFLGWYNGADKAAANVVISADTIFTATFVGAEDFVGAWYNDADKAYVIISNESTGNIVTNLFSGAKTGTFKPNGTMEFTSGSTVTLSLLNNVLTVSYSQWDGIEEDYITHSYNLSAQSVDTSVKAINYSSKEIIINHGIITKLENSVYYGRLIEEDGELSAITCEYSYSAAKTSELSVDENGIWLFAGRHYFATTEANRSSFSFSGGENGYETLIKYVVDTETYFIYQQNNAQSVAYDDFVTVQGELVLGEIITIKFANGSEKVFKLVTPKYGSNPDLQPRGAEAGTYSGPYGSVTLDGFGGITGDQIAGNDQTYSVVEGYIICGEQAFIGNKENNTYSIAEAIDGGVDGEFDLSGNTYYKATFYDFGLVVLDYNNGSSIYSGEYTVNNGKIVVSGVNYYINDTYSVEENGNALVGATRIYVKHGVTIPSHFDEFVGSWADSGKSNTLVVSENKTVKFNGAAVNYKANYNETVLTFEAACATDMYNTATYTATLSADGETVVITAQARTSYDSVYEDYTYEDITITLTPAEEEQPVQPAHSCVGTWTATFFGGSHTIVLNADGSVSYDGAAQSGVWTEESASEIKWVNGDYSYTFNSSKASLEIEYDYEACPVSNVSFTPAQPSSEPELDAFAGTWTGKVGVNNYTVICDGNGSISINGTNFDYTPGSTTISVGVFTVTMNSNGTMHVVYDDGDSNFDGNLTKQS